MSILNGLDWESDYDADLIGFHVCQYGWFMVSNYDWLLGCLKHGFNSSMQLVVYLGRTFNRIEWWGLFGLSMIGYAGTSVVGILKKPNSARMTDHF